MIQAVVAGQDGCVFSYGHARLGEFSEAQFYDSSTLATICRPTRRHFVASVDETLRCTKVCAPTDDKLLQAIYDVYFDHFVFFSCHYSPELDLIN